VEFLFYLLPFIFPGMKILMVSTVVASAIFVLLTGLLLYGAHTVSSENNRMDYVYIDVIWYVLI
jgi:hypothetical protein